MNHLYRKKPIVIQAWQLKNVGSLVEIPDFIDLDFVSFQHNSIGSIKGASIHTLEGKMQADIGDYIIRGVAGELYPCKPDIFEKTYTSNEKYEEYIEALKAYEHSRGESSGMTCGWNNCINDKAEDHDKHRRHLSNVTFEARKIIHSYTGE